MSPLNLKLESVLVGEIKETFSLEGAFVVPLPDDDTNIAQYEGLVNLETNQYPEEFLNCEIWPAVINEFSRLVGDNAAWLPHQTVFFDINPDVQVKFDGSNTLLVFRYRIVVQAHNDKETWKKSACPTFRFHTELQYAEDIIW